MSNNTGFWVGTFSAPDTYELINELGSGGEGQVWKAVVPLSDSGRRFVAIKVMHATAGVEAEERWKRFGHLLTTLSHPGLVRVTDVFTGPRMHRADSPPPSESNHYVVMDYIPGDTLREWIADHPEANVATRILHLRTIASALDEMHSGHSTGVPVAHGDIKPENIIVTTSGGTILVDLGLARLSDDETGAIGRTNPYAAPELLTPGGAATPASDSFAFAATLAHLLTGQPPPLDVKGQLDLGALDELLIASPITANRPALVEHVRNALTAPPELRPQQLASWMNGLTATVSQLVGAGAKTVLSARNATGSPVGEPEGSGDRRASRPSRRLVLPAAITAAVVLISAAAFAIGNASTADGESGSVPLATATRTILSTVTSSRVTVTTTSKTTATVTATATASERESDPPSSETTVATSQGASVNKATSLDLTSKEPVECDGCETSATKVNVSGASYTSTVRTSTNGGRKSYASYNVDRKWKTLNVDVGFNDTDVSSISGKFTVYADGIALDEEPINFGQTAHMTVNIEGALRVTFETVIQGGRWDDTAVWINPTVSR